MTPWQLALVFQIEPEDLGEILAGGLRRVFGDVVFRIMFEAFSILHLMRPTEDLFKLFRLNSPPVHIGEGMAVFMAQDVHSRNLRPPTKIIFPVAQ